LFLRDAGVQSMSNVFQFFELPIRLRLLGEDGISMEDFNYSGPNLIPDNVQREDHWRNFAMNITPGSLLGSSRDREKQVAIAMAEKGVLPLRVMWRITEAGDPEQLFKMLQEERESGVSPKSSKSSGQGTSRLSRSQRTGGV